MTRNDASYLRLVSRNFAVAAATVAFFAGMPLARTGSVATATDSASAGDTAAVAVVVEGVLISRETGAPPDDDSIAVTVDSVPVAVSEGGEFSMICRQRDYYTVEVASRKHAPFRQTITFTPGKTNYFLTIMLDRKIPAAKAASHPAAQAAAVPWTISGTVIDSRFDLAVRSDSITLLFDGDTVRVSDNGNFMVSTHFPGVHTFFVSIPGYHQVTESITLDDDDKQPFITIPTTILGRAVTRREITVTASSLPVHRSASVAKIDVSRKELQRATATMNDPLRALQTLPGVAAESDVAARPVIRGGDVLESRAFLDGVTLIQPYHFGGVRSNFNQMGLSALTLYKSGFPAELHNAQSGIIEAASRIPSDEKMSLEADINYLQYGAYAGVPLFKGMAGINISSQGSYFDAISKLMYRAMGATTGNQSMSDMGKLVNLPDYRDFSAGFSLTPSPRFKVFINEMFNSDRMRFCEGDSMIDITFRYSDTSVIRPYYYFGITDTDHYRDIQPLEGRYHDGNPKVGKPYFDIDTIMDYLSHYNVFYGTARYTLADNHLINLTAAWQKRWWDLAFPAANEFIDTTVYDVAIDQYNGSLGWIYSGATGHTVKAGVQVDYTKAVYNVYIVRYLHEMIVNGSTNLTDFWGPVNGDTALTESGEDEGFLYELMNRMFVNYNGSRRYWNIGVYAHDSWDALPRLHLDIGTRIEYGGSDHATSFSPRLALRYNLSDNHELIGSAGHYTQNNYDISAIALAEDLKPEKVWHSSIGLESKLLSWLTGKVDIYWKYYYDLLSEVMTPFKEVIRERYDIELGRSGETVDDQQPDLHISPFENFLFRSHYVNDGRGYAFGTEYMLRFDPYDFWHGWISLSWGRSIRERRPGWRRHPFPLDRPLLVSVHNYYRLPKNYDFGLKYRYMSGLPYTSVTLNNNGITIGDFNDRRYAAYHRLDLRFAKGFSVRDAKGHFYIEIWNSMNAPNLFLLDGKTKKLVTFSSNLPTTTLFIGVDCVY